MGETEHSYFDGGGIWLFAILALFLFGRNGFGWGNGGEQVATAADVQRSTDFAALERQNNEGVAATRQAAYDVMGAIKDSSYNNLSEIRALQSQVAENGYHAQQCCCENLRAIDGVKFDMANYACAIQKTNTDNTQKILDAITGNRMADMQNQINQLQLQSALCGVVRYPVGMAYNAGPSPFCATGCGCGTTCGC